MEKSRRELHFWKGLKNFAVRMQGEVARAAQQRER